VKLASFPEGVRLPVEAAQNKKTAVVVVIDLRPRAFTEYSRDLHRL
jgi:hypothetical protein